MISYQGERAGAVGTRNPVSLVGEASEQNVHGLDFASNPIHF